MSSYEDLWQLADLGSQRLPATCAQAAASHRFPVYFHDSVVEGVRRSQPSARERGVTFVASFAGSSNSDAAVEVLGDPVLLEAMVEYVVCSAVRSSPQGSRVELDTRVRDDSVDLFVRHHGAGAAVDRPGSVSGWHDVPPGMVGSSGNGFDLDVAKRVAEFHRGGISLRQLADGGREFRLVLPRRPAVGGHLLRFEGRTGSAAHRSCS